MEDVGTSFEADARTSSNSHARFRALGTCLVAADLIG